MKEIIPMVSPVMVDYPKGFPSKVMKSRTLKLLIVDPTPIGIQHKLVILEAAAATVALLHSNSGIPFHLCSRLLGPARAKGSNEDQDQHGRIGCDEKPAFGASLNQNCRTRRHVKKQDETHEPECSHA